MTPRRAGVHPGRNDTPPAGVVLGVWYEPEQREIAAVWDGQQWRARDGDVLAVQPVWWYVDGKW